MREKSRKKIHLDIPPSIMGERSGKKSSLFHWSIPSKSLSQSTFVVKGPEVSVSILLHEFSCTFPLMHSLWLHFLRFLFGNSVILIPFHFSRAWFLKCTQVLPICWSIGRAFWFQFFNRIQKFVWRWEFHTFELWFSSLTVAIDMKFYRADVQYRFSFKVISCTDPFRCQGTIP